MGGNSMANKLDMTNGRFDVRMAQCVVINEIDKELLNYRVFSADTPEGFPSKGDVGCIYKANKESELYQWNDELQNYQSLNKSSTSIEVLQGIVEGLQTDMTDLQTIVGKEDNDKPLTTRIAEAEDKIAILNGDKSVTGSVLQIVKDEINAFATNVSDDGVVNSYKELIDYVAEHGAETAAITADITLLKQLVGDKSVAEQITTAIDERLSGDFGDTLLDKLNGIEPNAQVNKIEKINVGGQVIDAIDKTVKIPVADLDTPGVTKSSTGANKVNVSNDGEMSVKQISVNSIFVPIGDELILGGGDSLGELDIYTTRIGNIGYDNVAEAINFAGNGDVITLQNDIHMGDADDDHLIINTENISIDLGGKTLTANGSMGAVKVESGIVTFDGTGTIKGTLGSDDYSMAIWAAGSCKVVINDGLYRNETDGTERGTDLIYASGDSCIEINGGVFEAAKPEWTLNCKDADCKAGKANIIVKGGSFKHFDPANNNAEGPNTCFVADGYKSTKDGDYYIVTPA